MLTVREYSQLSRWQKLAYRVHRHPLVLFGIGIFGGASARCGATPARSAAWRSLARAADSSTWCRTMMMPSATSTSALPVQRSRVRVDSLRVMNDRSALVTACPAEASRRRE